MAFTLKYIARGNYVHGVFRGRFDDETVRDYAKALVRLARQHDCTRVLHDLRAADVPVEITAYASYLKIFEEEGVDRTWRRSIVSAASVGDYEFYETLSQNRGFNVAVFTEQGAAKAWLLDKTSD